jgi:glyoxylase-like metal-dependent hydrolase (beta-lactamase superfamily II)
VILADTKNPGWGKALLDKIRTVTDQPVTTVINTHSHADHVGGNIDMPPSAEIVMHERTRANVLQMDAFKGGKGVATRTFKDRLTIGSGQDRVELYYFGPGQTGGDTWIVFPAGGVVVMGDIFGLKNPTRIDTPAGGSALLVADTLAKGVATVKGVDTVVMGHGDVVPWRDLEEFAQFNRQLRDDVRAALAQGKTPEDISTTWKVPDQYKGYTAAPARLKENAEKIADELR